MRGVDRDQIIDLYNSGRRSKKWWKRLFIHLLEWSILNGNVLRQHPANLHLRMDYFQFWLLSFLNYLEATAAGREASNKLLRQKKHVCSAIWTIFQLLCGQFKRLCARQALRKKGEKGISPQEPLQMYFVQCTFLYHKGA